MRTSVNQSMNICRSNSTDFPRLLAPVLARFCHLERVKDRPIDRPKRLPDPAKPMKCHHNSTSEKWCCRGGLNSRPPPYQGGALPLSYGSVWRAASRAEVPPSQARRVNATGGRVAQPTAAGAPHSGPGGPISARSALEPLRQDRANVVSSVISWLSAACSAATYRARS